MARVRTMEAVFTWCAVIAGTIFGLQFLMLLMGLDGGNDLDFETPDLDVPDLDVPEMDVDLDDPELDVPEEIDHVSIKDGEVDFDRPPDAFTHSDSWFVGIITFRSLVAAIAVFGLTGRAAIQHLPPEKAIALAVLSGVGMLYLVGWSFKKIYQLQADGTVKMEHAVGCTGTVYLTIPGHHEGPGKVTVKVAERTMEYRAMTKGEPLTTGTPIVVTSVLSEDTLEVKSQLPA
ncbi:MAG: hypothetical protein HUJ26_20845 [Planctomycetaceae bacterium]|nr:hypothetical protein [Planctomycetaceae bacterium]